MEAGETKLSPLPLISRVVFETGAQIFHLYWVAITAVFRAWYMVVEVLLLRPIELFLRWCYQQLAVLLQPLHGVLLYINQQKWQWILSLLWLVIGGCSLLLLAMLSYGFFYTQLVPNVRIQGPLYFHFREFSSPTATAFIDPDFFYGGQEYDITLHMELPENPQNINAGMFMIGLELSLVENATVFTTSRPCVVRYKSPLLHVMSTIFYGIPLVLGWREEVQHVTLPVLEAWKDAFDKATVRLNKPEIQVYSASFQVEVRLYGLRYLCYHWFLTSYLLGTTFFFSLEVLLVLLLWLAVRARIASAPPSTAVPLISNNGVDHIPSRPIATTPALQQYQTGGSTEEVNVIDEYYRLQAESSSSNSSTTRRRRNISETISGDIDGLEGLDDPHDDITTNVTEAEGEDRSPMPLGGDLYADQQQLQQQQQQPQLHLSEVSISQSQAVIGADTGSAELHSFATTASSSSATTTALAVIDGSEESGDTKIQTDSEHEPETDVITDALSDPDTDSSAALLRKRKQKK